MPDCAEVERQSRASANAGEMRMDLVDLFAAAKLELLVRPEVVPLRRDGRIEQEWPVPHHDWWSFPLLDRHCQVRSPNSAPWANKVFIKVNGYRLYVCCTHHLIPKFPKEPSRLLFEMEYGLPLSPSDRLPV